MNLSYRGAEYERDFLPLEMRSGDIAGKYRGQAWNYRYPRHIPQLEPKLYRQYRGVSYSTRPCLDVSMPRVLSPVVTAKTVAVESDNLSEIHLENIRRRLEVRLQIARERGDRYLLDMLGRESRELSLDI